MEIIDRIRSRFDNLRERTYPDWWRGNPSLRERVGSLRTSMISVMSEFGSPQPEGDIPVTLVSSLYKNRPVAYINGKTDGLWESVDPKSWVYIQFYDDGSRLELYAKGPCTGTFDSTVGLEALVGRAEGVLVNSFPRGVNITAVLSSIHGDVSSEIGKGLASLHRNW